MRAAYPVAAQVCAPPGLSEVRAVLREALGLEREVDVVQCGPVLCGEQPGAREGGGTLPAEQEWTERGDLDVHGGPAHVDAHALGTVRATAQAEPATAVEKRVVH